MPIQRNKFSEAKKTIKDRILNFLKDNPDKAYRLAEIMSELEDYDNALILLIFIMDKNNPDSLLNKYTKAIEELLKQNLIERAEISGSAYFAIKD